LFLVDPYLIGLIIFGVFLVAVVLWLSRAN